MTCVQSFLSQWSNNGDVHARHQAASLCFEEFQPVFRRLVGRHSFFEVDDLVSQALQDLVYTDEGRRSRLLAPEGYRPRAWRRRVLRNWYVDQYRSHRRRLAGRDVLQREQVVLSGPSTPEESLVARERLAFVERVLAQVSTARRRALLAVEFGANPQRWAADLATELNHPLDDVVNQLERAVANRESGSEARVRVTHPDRPLAEARAAHMRMLRYARAEFKSLAEEALV